MARKLRIAVSVFFGVLTMALCVLWVRSYWCRDAIYGPLMRPHVFNLSTSWGRVRFASFDRTYEDNFTGEKRTGWGITSSQIEEQPSVLLLMLVNTPLSNYGLGFAGSSDRYGVVAIIPIWFPVMLTSILAIAPWVNYRFSLRTLLIATTLVAVGLGLAVWIAGR